MLARELVPFIEKKGHQVAHYPRKSLDIANVDILVKTFLGLKWKPEVVINCAAYTGVDRAEEEVEEAFSVNRDGASYLAVICKEIGARLVHISTDFVFDGHKNTPYKEGDRAKPLSVYGRSKLEGERAIQKETGNFIIIRTSWLYGPGKDNFVKKIIKLASEREELSVVYDQVGTPTYTEDLSTAIINLLDKPAGIYHFSNEGVASWYDFACGIMESVKRKGAAVKLKNLKPVLTGEYPARAKRPPYSVLDKSKYKKVTGKSIPHWMEALSRYIDASGRAR